MGYKIEQDVSGFILYHNDRVLCKFFRDSFRNDLELYAQTNNLSSQWIGCILRLFLQKFPPSPPPRVSAVERFRNDELIDYLKCRGYKITTPLRSDLDDQSIIIHLEKQGYVIQGNNHLSPAMLITLN